MDKLSKIRNKRVLAHMGFFDKDSHTKYKKNSKEVCAISNTMDHIDVVELDIRKSLDDVLYCYHGNLFEYCITLKFPMNISSLYKKYEVDTLEDVLSVIGQKKTIILDIKDTSINREDILGVFRNKNFKEIILANKSVRYLDRFSNMPTRFVKMMNGNIFYNFYNLKKLKEKGYKYIEVMFPFQISKERIKKVESMGINFWCSGLMFLNPEHYWYIMEKYNIGVISSDFL